MTKKRISKKEHDFILESGQILKMFLKKVDGIESAIEKTMAVLNKNAKVLRKQRIDFIASHSKNNLTIVDYVKYDKLNNDYLTSLLSARTVPVSLFISLVLYFETFCKEQLALNFKLFPQILNSSEKNLSQAEITSMKSMKEVKSYAISREIESVMDDRLDYFKWYKEHLKLDLLQEKIFKIYVEISARRNIYVHNNGIVNRQYIDHLKKYSIKSKYKIGEEIKMTPEYFFHSSICIAVIAVITNRFAIRKALESGLPHVDADFTEVCMNINQQKKYVLVHEILDLSKKYLETNAGKDIIRVNRINQAIALKNMGFKKRVNELLKSEDWEEADPIYLLALAVLKNNKKSIIPLMHKVGKGDWIEEGYATWPLFKDIRKDKKFQNAYKKIFGKSLPAKIRSLYN